MEIIRAFINGGQMPQFANKKVSMIGLVSEIAPNGLSLDLKAVDDVIVKVNLKKPPEETLTGYVQVNGTCAGKSITADEVVTFKSECEFDTKAHNKVCSFLNTVPNLYNVS